ncbi:MAG: cation:proton antiporter [Hyphomonas sp.]|jgi:K+:H+ antiporter|nr:cation:proton antiporter [Henriciella sp.]MBO6696684.1 cation:proton antiporter [Henriciella sp.]MCR9224950.1 cation:proton antiporter [Hyphomonas sp.]
MAVGHEGQEIMIKDALVFLVAAGLVVPILRALKLPAVVAFILAGVALGPSGFSAFSEQVPVLEYLTISDPAAAAPFAELGVLFLLFLLGLELSFQKLWALKRTVFGAGTMQVLLSAMVIGYTAYLLGQPPAAAAIIGLALALSSTAIVMQVLTEKKLAAGPVGRTSLGVLLFQDIMVAPILIFVGFTASQSDAGLVTVLGQALLNGLIALLAIFLIGRFLLRHLFRLAAHAGGRDFLMAITLLTVVGASVITANAGLSLALGAFLAGLLLGETEFKHQTEIDLEPFKGLLLGLFFLTVGLAIDLGVVIENWPIVFGGLLALLIVKALIAVIAIRIFSGTWPVAFESAALLAPAGEFAFVILGAGLAAGTLLGETTTLLTAIVALSMLIITISWRGGIWLAERITPAGESHPLPNDFSDVEGHVIVAGFGRVGRAVAHILDRENAEIVGLETNPNTVAKHRREGWHVYFGDGGRQEVLERAGLAQAGLVVVTLDDATRAESMVKAARLGRPDVPILARARDADHARSLYTAGATFVIPDAIEAGLQMSARALVEMGYETETVRALIASERETEYQMADENVEKPDED